MYELGDPDLVMFAKSLGAEAYAVKSPADLEELMPKVIKRANGDNKPQVVIAHINRTPVPPYYNPVYGPKPAGK
jgi:acetolactate synthase-1/2/3 large subunit